MAIKGGYKPFSSNVVTMALDCEGVYALYDHDDLIYIGRSHGQSKTIRTRLQDHKDGRAGQGTRKATLYRQERCDDPVARKRELLTEYISAHGGLPRCNATKH